MRVFQLLYKAYCIDLDGTMYRGTERIDGAKEFVDNLKKQDTPFVFVTNNSSATPAAVASKLAAMDIHIHASQIMTSALATAQYIKREKANASVYMIGEEGLEEALLQNQLRLREEAVDYVVIGMDRDLSYEKLAKASVCIQNGAKFISTNKDAAIPTERGFLPGNGSLTSVLTVCTGVEPTFIGKPQPQIMEEALTTLGLEAQEVLMVGDNYETDILAGIHTKMDTLMVLTGYSTKEDLAVKYDQPTYIMNNLFEWIEKRQEEE